MKDGPREVPGTERVDNPYQYTDVRSAETHGGYVGTVQRGTLSRRTGRGLFEGCAVAAVRLRVHAGAWLLLAGVFLRFA